MLLHVKLSNLQIPSRVNHSRKEDVRTTKQAGELVGLRTEEAWSYKVAQTRVMYGKGYKRKPGRAGTKHPNMMMKKGHLLGQ